MSSEGIPEEGITLDGTSIEEITGAILADLEKEKLRERINDLGLNYNYYFKTGTEESIGERLFYECPIFTTHNTFIKHDGLLSESRLPNLDKYIEELVSLTLNYPICVEIDIKGNCMAGHFLTTIKDGNKEISIKNLCIKIIKKYYLNAQERHPLIIHLDIPDKECFLPQDFKDIKTAYTENLSGTNGPWEFSTKLYKECKNKVIFREKIYQKKAEKADEAIREAEAPLSADDAGDKPRRRSSLLMKVMKQKPKQEAPKKFYYTKIPEFEDEGIPYITYGQSMAFNKPSASFFDGGYFLTGSPFPLQVGLHSRIYPGLTTCLKNQNKFSEILLEQVINLFCLDKSIKHVPTLIAINYLTSDTSNLSKLKEKFTDFYKKEDPKKDTKVCATTVSTPFEVSIPETDLLENNNKAGCDISPGEADEIRSEETPYPKLLQETMVGGASKKKKKNRAKRVRKSVNKKKRQYKISKRLRKRTRKVKN